MKRSTLMTPKIHKSHVKSLTLFSVCAFSEEKDSLLDFANFCALFCAFFISLVYNKYTAAAEETLFCMLQIFLLSAMRFMTSLSSSWNEMREKTKNSFLSFSPFFCLIWLRRPENESSFSRFFEWFVHLWSFFCAFSKLMDDRSLEKKCWEVPWGEERG